MASHPNDLEVVFSNMIKTTSDPQRILVCLRFLALQAIAQGKVVLASDLEDLLNKHEDDLDRPELDYEFSKELH